MKINNNASTSVIAATVVSLKAVDFGMENKHQENKTTSTTMVEIVQVVQEDHVINSKEMVSVVLVTIADFPTTQQMQIVEVIMVITEDSNVVATVVVTTIIEIITAEEDLEEETSFATNSEILETAALVITANSAMMPLPLVEMTTGIKAIEL